MTDSLTALPTALQLKTLESLDAKSRRKLAETSKTFASINREYNKRLCSTLPSKKYILILLEDVLDGEWTILGKITLSRPFDVKEKAKQREALDRTLRRLIESVDKTNFDDMTEEYAEEYDDFLNNVAKGRFIKVGMHDGEDQLIVSLPVVDVIDTIDL